MTTTPARPWYVTVIVVIFVIDGTNGAAQVVMRLLGESSDPSALVFWQTGVALTAWATAWAGWQMRRLAVELAILNGVVLSLMLLQLPTMIEIEPEAITGLRSAAAMVFVVVLLLAAGLYRGTRKS